MHPIKNLNSNVTFTSLVCVSTIFLLFVVENENHGTGVASGSITFITSFDIINELVQKLVFEGVGNIAS